MPSIPVPLVTLLVLLILIVTLAVNDKQRHQTTLLFLVVCSLLLGVGALRWIWPSTPLMALRVLLATLIPALAWHCFSPHTTHQYSRWKIVPPALAIIIMQCWPEAIDSALFLLYIGYGAALILMGLGGGDRFSDARIGEVVLAARMALTAGIFLCFSGMTDLLVALEFTLHQGKLVPQLIALLQSLMLPLLSLAIVLAARTRPREVSIETVLPDSSPLQTPEQAALCLQLENRLRQDDLFLNTQLTLNLLARKAGIPSRHISRAINATYHCNVSQWINGFRIAHAQQLLRSSSLPVTEVMLASGFTTKSNFNREFLRISGQTPSAFRQQAGSMPLSESE